MTDRPTATVDDDRHVDYEGRNIVLKPVPPGLWLILLGAGAAVLGPAGGFLVGSIIGVGDGDATVNPVFLALVIGLIIGGIGGLVALLGGLKFIRNRTQTEVAEEAAAPAVEASPPASR